MHSALCLHSARAAQSAGVREPSAKSQSGVGRDDPDRRTTFRIHIRQLDWDTFHYFLPIGAGYAVLRELVGFILREPLAYDISLSMPDRSSQPLQLANNNQCRLGWTSWLGQQAGEGTIIVAGNSERVNDNG